MSKPWHAVIGLACVAGLVCAPAHARADSEADSQRSLELFREGNQAFAKGDLQNAYAAYREAWGLHQSFDVACNLGRTEAELELNVAAAEHLDYCLRTFAASAKNDMREAEKKFRALFDGVRAKVTALHVNSRPLTAEVLVDGASMGQGPFDHDLFMAAGERQILVKSRGYVEHRETLTASAGGTRTLEVKLARIDGAPVAPETAPTANGSQGPSPAPSSTPSQSSPDSAEQTRSLVPVYVGVGLAAVGLGAFIGFRVAAGSDKNEAQDLANQHGPGACAGASAPADCSKQRDAAESYDRKIDLSTASIAVGGAALAFAAAYYFWPQGDAETRTASTRFRWSASLMPTGGSLSAGGAFE